MRNCVRGLNLFIVRPHQSRNKGFNALDGMRSEIKGAKGGLIKQTLITASF